MKLAIIMPRNMHFGPLAATSIDLVVHDLVRAMPVDVQVTVYGEDCVQPFDGIKFRGFPRKRLQDKLNFLGNIKNSIQTDGADLIIVQQHLRSAVVLKNALPNIPIALHRHNFHARHRSSWIKNFLDEYALKKMDALIFVSTACANHFLTHWPRILREKVFVVPNGLDLSAWQPATDREPEILYAGRLAPEKGVLELAQALVQVLPSRPNWRARLICSAVDVHPQYASQVQQVLAPLAAQIQIIANQPFAVIKSACEQAAIAVVPSLWQEPFGRTAIEAMAGGAALISSTRGGLNEVVGDDGAVRLSELTPDEIAVALSDLMDHPVERAKVAAQGRARAQKFTTAAQVQAFMAVAQTIIKA